MSTCSATVHFPNVRIGGELKVTQVDNAVIIPATARPDAVRPGKAMKQGGLLADCVGGVVDSHGNAVPEAVQYRRRQPVITPDGWNASDAPDQRRGTHLYGGPLFGHYGHFIIESLARLWITLDIRDDQYDGIFFYRMPGASIEVLDWIGEIFSALNIPHRKLNIMDSPVRCEQLIVPSAGFELYNFAHPKMADLYERMSRNVISSSPAKTKRKAMYVSRLNVGAKYTIGEREFQNILENHGIDIIYAENLDLRQKIISYNQYEYIIGLCGSGLHNILFSINNPKLYILNRFSIIYPSYPIIDSIKNIDSIYADVSMDARERSANKLPYFMDVYSAVSFLVNARILPECALIDADNLDYDKMKKYYVINTEKNMSARKTKSKKFLKRLFATFKIN